ncbi:hypothetical protein H9P43_006666 [Blastocladiella emersonii ATCC 22665]|nr:hypothetical protein H9P43_006666 [Blastocladiella emersonii ATCC 22665]
MEHSTTDVGAAVTPPATPVDPAPTPDTPAATPPARKRSLRLPATPTSRRGSTDSAATTVPGSAAPSARTLSMSAPSFASSHDTLPMSDTDSLRAAPRKNSLPPPSSSSTPPATPTTSSASPSTTCWTSGPPCSVRVPRRASAVEWKPRYAVACRVGFTAKIHLARKPEHADARALVRGDAAPERSITLPPACQVHVVSADRAPGHGAMAGGSAAGGGATLVLVSACGFLAEKPAARARFARMVASLARSPSKRVKQDSAAVAEDDEPLVDDDDDDLASTVSSAAPAWTTNPLSPGLCRVTALSTAHHEPAPAKRTRPAASVMSSHALPGPVLLRFAHLEDAHVFADILTGRCARDDDELVSVASPEAPPPREVLSPEDAAVARYLTIDEADAVPPVPPLPASPCFTEYTSASSSSSSSSASSVSGFGAPLAGNRNTILFPPRSHSRRPSAPAFANPLPTKQHPHPMPWPFAEHGLASPPPTPPAWRTQHGHGDPPHRPQSAPLLRGSLDADPGARLEMRRMHEALRGIQENQRRVNARRGSAASSVAAAAACAVAVEGGVGALAPVDEEEAVMDAYDEEAVIDAYLAA